MSITYFGSIKKNTQIIIDTSQIESSNQHLISLKTLQCNIVENDFFIKDTLVIGFDIPIFYIFGSKNFFNKIDDFTFSFNKSYDILNIDLFYTFARITNDVNEALLNAFSENTIIPIQFLEILQKYNFLNFNISFLETDPSNKIKITLSLPPFGRYAETNEQFIKFYFDLYHREILPSFTYLTIISTTVFDYNTPNDLDSLETYLDNLIANFPNIFNNSLNITPSLSSEYFCYNTYQSIFPFNSELGNVLTCSSNLAFTDESILVNKSTLVKNLFFNIPFIYNFSKSSSKILFQAPYLENRKISYMPREIILSFNITNSFQEELFDFDTNIYFELTYKKLKN